MKWSCCGSWGNIVKWLGYGLDIWGIMVQSLVGARDCLFLQRPDLYWSYTKPPIRWVIWNLSGGWSGKGVQSSAKVNEWRYISSPHYTLIVCTGTALSLPLLIHNLLVLYHHWYKLKRLQKHSSVPDTPEPAAEGTSQMEYSFHSFVAQIQEY
jgi:hypothetical protein